MRVFICANLSKQNSLTAVKSVCEELLKIGFVPMMESKFSDIPDMDGVMFSDSDTLINDCDMLITVGGDGTILKWGRRAAKADKPLLGVNTGRLGFMATLEYHELHKLSCLKDGKYTISRRMLLDVYCGTVKYLAVNDVVFDKKRAAKLPEFSVTAGDYEVMKIRADGIIFSTPTGSTAYALSAGGPIIAPDARCIEFTPLCAHTLFARPMLFSDDTELLVSFKSYENGGVTLNIDGDGDIDLKDGGTVTIKRSALTLSTLDIDGGGFYDAVHNKLMRPLK